MNAITESRLPQPIAEPPPIEAPRDVVFPGQIVLRVDATDIQRGIFRVHETLPVRGRQRITLLYPKWLPGYHSPAASIELVAGLRIRAGEQELAWKRDPVEVHAFHVDVLEGAETLEVEFQFLTPTAESQGDISVTPDMLMLRWNSVLLYPAGYFSRRIEVAPCVTLPKGWSFGCALGALSHDGSETTTFEPVALDVLVDSPLLAGRHMRCETLDTQGEVRLHLAAERPDQLAATDDQLTPHRSLVVEADALFGARHFDRYEVLMALSDELGSAGVEHHRSCEIVSVPGYFTSWGSNAPARETIAHEYVHSWNGKHRRGADSWTPSFELPIRNSLMWVYEGQTQYWGQVLAARCGLWTADQARDALARTAAIYANRAGGRWRPMSDTTRDPIIVERAPQPWASWQRSEDYYSEGQLMWLDADTLIREITDDRRSLDDFARSFFGVSEGGMATHTYTFDDVVQSLDRVAPHDWADFLTGWLENRESGTRLTGLERGGYRLVYRDTPNDYALLDDASAGVINLRFSIGVAISPSGSLQEVLWDSPAFKAGLTAGAQVLAVNGRAFSEDEIKQAIVDAQDSGRTELLVKRGKHHQALTVEYADGHRFPHLEPTGGRTRLNEIHAAKTKG